MKQKIALWIINRLLKWIPEYKVIKPKDIPQGFHLHKNPKRKEKK